MYKHLKHEPNLYAPNTALAVYRNSHSAQSIIDASPLRFELGRAESSSSVSQFMPSTLPSADGEEEDSTPAQDESDYAQEEFSEVNSPRQRPNEASGEGTTFTGLSGTARWGTMRSSASTDQEAISPSPSPPPKTFTPNPTPLKASSADLPNPPASTQEASISSDNPREFQLTIERSVLNHHVSIQREHYYDGFQLDLGSAMGDDLEGRVPVAGLADCQLDKPQVPLRVRLRRRQEADKRGWMSLGRLWEEGERERARETERKTARELAREAGGNVGDDDGVREYALLR